MCVCVCVCIRVCDVCVCVCVMCVYMCVCVFESLHLLRDCNTNYIHREYLRRSLKTRVYFFLGRHGILVVLESGVCVMRVLCVLCDVTWHSDVM